MPPEKLRTIGGYSVGHWENDTLDKLFTKIRDTMPAGGIESVTDAGKLDILAFVLAANGAPAGREELSLELPALEAITIVRQGGAPEGVCRTSTSSSWLAVSHRPTRDGN